MRERNIQIFLNTNCSYYTTIIEMSIKKKSFIQYLTK